MSRKHPHANPPRLSESSPWADELQTIAGEAPSPDAIAQAGAALETSLENLPPGGGEALAASSTVVKLAVATVVVGASAVFLLTREPAPPPQPPEAPAAAPAAAPEVPDVVPAPMPAVEPEAVVDPQPSPPPVVQSAQPRAPAAPEPANAASQIKEQLALFKRAREAATAGRTDDALRLLTELEQRFAGGPFEPEALLLRVDVLNQADRIDEALDTARRMTTDARLRGKRADLYGLLGELWRRKGDCKRAVEAWQAALGIGLPDQKVEETRAAINACR